MHTSSYRPYLFAVLLALTLGGCSAPRDPVRYPTPTQSTAEASPPPAISTAQPGSPPAPAELPTTGVYSDPDCSLPDPISDTLVLSYTVVNTYTHSASSFTEGLVYAGGFLYESTGTYGASAARVLKVDLETGKPVLTQTLSPASSFGEGLTAFNNLVYQLTYTSHIGLVYTLEELKPTGQTFIYPTEGWGLTHDGHRLIMSDGSAWLSTLDPNDLRPQRWLRVQDGSSCLDHINELEYINGVIYANIFPTNYIALIRADTGVVVGWIDLSALLDRVNDRIRPQDIFDAVPNGIAYDPVGKRLFVTGKLWPYLFEIRLECQKLCP
jgi:glutamine cyclotransferase